MIYIGIVAVSANGAIGKNGKLPWHYPADLKFFKETTLGSCVLMGRNTWESIRKPLPNRRNFVLTKSICSEELNGVTVISSKVEVVSLLNGCCDEVYIIGGGKTYDLFRDDISIWYVTEIPETINDADVFFDWSLLEDFVDIESKDLEGNLKVRVLSRKM